MPVNDKTTKRLVFLYGEEIGRATAAKLAELFRKRRHCRSLGRRRVFTERDVVLITYADMVAKDGERPLATLESFLESHCADVVDAIHFLPFFPYSSSVAAIHNLSSESVDVELDKLGLSGGSVDLISGKRFPARAITSFVGHQVMWLSF